MGTDIHVIPELSFNSDRTWSALLPHAMPLARDYALFHRLAGVRGNTARDGDPIAPNRGFPRNASPETCKVFDHHSLHSITWLSITEARAAYPVSANWQNLVEYVDGLYYGAAVRFVIGFDS